MSHCAYITRIKNLRKHSNADRLMCADCFGNQVIVGLDTKEGQLGIYFPTDSKVGLEYAEANNLLRKKDPETGESIGGYLDENKRHIKTLKLRKEISDGLFMPVESLRDFCDIDKLKEGQTIDVLDGKVICEKYVPKLKKRSQGQQNKNKKVKVVNYPHFKEHLDTKQLAYSTREFKEGDLCYILLKMHGTSARTSKSLKTKNQTWMSKLLSKLGYEKGNDWNLVSGTRRVVLDSFDGGYYGSNEFRKQHHDFFEGKLHKGETIYYEIVGYVDEDSTIMPSCDNKKVNDKKFVAKYGKTTNFTYGCKPGESQIYVYRISTTNEDGYEVEYPWELVKLRCEQMGVKYTPQLDKFFYTTQEDLMERVNKHVDGVDPIGKTHIREGIVVRIADREQFKALKHKNISFKILEGIIKDSGVLDIEESASIEES